jgi:CheY-like chemotaxis protein
MPQRKRFRILVVDDDAANREMLDEILRDAGYRVFTAPDGPNALFITEANPPDVAFVDWIMLTMDGQAVARALKRRIPTLPVVAMSGSVPDMGALGDIGVDATLPKPFTIDDLLGLTNRLCHAARRN